MSNQIAIMAIANSLNADLIPPVREKLLKDFPDNALTDYHLSLLMCYALCPDDFRAADAGTIIRAFKEKPFQKVEDGLKLLPDQGLIDFHCLMVKDPKLTVKALQLFQHEDDKLSKNRIRKALRLNNCEGMSGNELIQFLIDTNVITERQRAGTRRRLNEMRNKDLENLDPQNLSYYRADE